MRTRTKHSSGKRTRGKGTGRARTRRRKAAPATTKRRSRRGRQGPQGKRSGIRGPLGAKSRKPPAPTEAVAFTVPAPPPADAPASPIDPRSEWACVVLRKREGPTSAQWACILQELYGPEDDTEVRGWFYGLLPEDGPWVATDGGQGFSSIVELFFDGSTFDGMPPFYEFEKSPTTRPGSLWRLTAPGGRLQGLFVVEGLRTISGADLIELESQLGLSSLTPAAQPIQYGQALPEWTAF